jgi:pimeloyl-ACP methyl ester carboxylesterase
MPGHDSKRSSRPARVRLPRTAPRPLAGLFMPQGYEAGYDYPLLVWLPDASDRGFDLGRAMTRVSLRNFVAVQPAASDSTSLTEAVWEAIDGVTARASIHGRRIFLLGHGSGGTEAFRIACRHADSFAGVISLGGPFPLDESLFASLHGVRRLPMLLCCRADAPPAAVQHTDRTLRLFHAAGAMLAMRIYPGCNDLSRAILGDVNRWLMDEICGPSTALHSQCAP